MRSWWMLATGLAVGLSLAAAAPLALLVEVEALGKGAQGTVVGVLVAVPPEERGRLGERVRIVTELVEDGRVLDRQSAVVSPEPDGSVLLYREWPPGAYELRVAIAALEGDGGGTWSGVIVVGTAEESFAPPADAPADAVALAATPPSTGAVEFLPPPQLGGIGAVQLEVRAPASAASVEFLRDGRSLGVRNRPPWTISVPLGAIVERTEVRAVCRDAAGAYLGEDALVLNNPTGQLAVSILLGPEVGAGGVREVRVAVSGAEEATEVRLDLDDRTVARWTACPCVTEVRQADLDAAAVLAAQATAPSGARGDDVLVLGAGGGFSGDVQVELVEVPVVVLGGNGVPVPDLTAERFTVLEDGSRVAVEGFGTTAELPLSLGLAVDISGSMEEEYALVGEAVKGFAASLLRPGDEAFLVTFSWDARVASRWSPDTADLSAALRAERPEGGTSLHDAVVRALEQFRGRRGRQALVLLTDGEDTTSRTGWRTAERFAHTMRVPVFPIGMGLKALDLSSRKVLRDLAAATGGEAFFPKNAHELPEVYAVIDRLLRAQYLLWYSSSSDKPREAFREVRVEVAGCPGCEVRTIKGYYPGR